MRTPVLMFTITFLCFSIDVDVMATSEKVMDHFKGIFSKDNLKRILNIGGPIGVVAGILFSFALKDYKALSGGKRNARS